MSAGGNSFFLSNSERPPWGDLDVKNKLFVVGLAGRSAFMVLKGLAFVGKSLQVAFLYRKTYKKWLTFETLFLVICAIKILILMPDVFIYELNWLFYALALNSSLAYTLSFELRSRTNRMLDATDASHRLSIIWYGARMAVLVFIMITPLIDFFDKKAPHYMVCDKLIYRKCLLKLTPLVAYNFLLIFVLDFVSALIDLVNLLRLPKFMSRRKRIRLMKRKVMESIRRSQ